MVFHQIELIWFLNFDYVGFQLIFDPMKSSLIVLFLQELVDRYDFRFWIDHDLGGGRSIRFLPELNFRSWQITDHGEPITLSSPKAKE